METSPEDAISAITFSSLPNSNKFAAASWDKKAYLYEVISDGSGTNRCDLVTNFEHRAPVLDVCFGATDNVLYTAGLDWVVRRYVKMPDR